MNNKNLNFTPRLLHQKLSRHFEHIKKCFSLLNFDNLEPSRYQQKFELYPTPPYELKHSSLWTSENQ
jgi:hypothetical protein